MSLAENRAWELVAGLDPAWAAARARVEYRAGKYLINSLGLRVLL